MKEIAHTSGDYYDSHKKESLFKRISILPSPTTIFSAPVNKWEATILWNLKQQSTVHSQIINRPDKQWVSNSLTFYALQIHFLPSFFLRTFQHIGQNGIRPLNYISSNRTFHPERGNVEQLNRRRRNSFVNGINSSAVKSRLEERNVVNCRNDWLVPVVPESGLESRKFSIGLDSIYCTFCHLSRFFRLIEDVLG